MIVAAVAWSVPAAAQRAPTVYDNAQSVPIGSRTAGMGGIAMHVLRQCWHPARFHLAGA